MSFGARALIRLGAFRHNLKLIKSRAPGARIMAVIKANAYGHGMLPVARALSEADCLAVARLCEAQRLREAGITTPLALLGGVLDASDLATALDLDLQIAVHNEPQIEWLERFGQADAKVWLKIDTGMNRLGFSLHQAPAMLARLENCAAVGNLGLMTHFNNADNIEDDVTGEQIRLFRDVVAGNGCDISIANSPGIFGWGDELTCFADYRDAGRWWVRPGLSLYGASPFTGQTGADLGLKPAMSFESVLIAVKSVQRGETVGYGVDWHVERDTNLGIVAAGYADGYSRFIPSGSPVLVNGRRVSVAGLVSMDLTAVDLGPGARDRVGDPVLLWGPDLPVEEIAACAGTIPYQLLCGVSGREEPEYVA